MQSTMAYVLSHIFQNIPREILDLAFEPNKYNTTLENRIIGQVIEGPILLDTSLVAGKRRDIFMSQSWEIDLPFDQAYNTIGNGVQNSYYKVPPEAREHRNINSVIGPAYGIQSSVPGGSTNLNGQGGFGNTGVALINQMLNTRTMSQYPVTPQATLMGTNIICFRPRMLIDGVALTVTLEYDSEFLNMNTSGIMAMRNLCLCAVKKYIYTKLVVPIDETEVVAGMEVGIIKDLVREYGEDAKSYEELLINVRGAALYDTAQISRLAYFAI